MRVLVYGDYVIDRYLQVTTTRGCPERPEAPVWDVALDQIMVGCAGNTLKNVLAMRELVSEDVHVFFGGIMGPRVRDLIPKDYRAYSTHTDSKLTRVSDVDIEKTRIVQDGVIVGRLDSLKRFDVPPPDLSSIPEFDLVIISDYGFGSVDERVAKRLIDVGKLSVVDSKREDLTIFRGATVFKLNQQEYDRQVSRLASTDDMCVENLCHWLVVSQGERGCTVKRSFAQDSSYRIDSCWINPNKADRVVDVTGCGDTFTAALGLSLTTKRDIFLSAVIANFLASRVVRELGPATPDHDSIKLMRGKFI